VKAELIRSVTCSTQYSDRLCSFYTPIYYRVQTHAEILQ